MKKSRLTLLIVLLAVVMLFSHTAVSFAVDSSESDAKSAENETVSSVLVSIISPSVEETSGDSVFISVSVAPAPFSSRLATAVRVSVNSVLTETNEDGEPTETLTPVRERVVKEGTGGWYYTERLEDLAPGVYRVTVEAKNAYANENVAFEKAAEKTITLTEKQKEAITVEIETEPKQVNSEKKPNGIRKIVEIIRNLFGSK